MTKKNPPVWRRVLLPLVVVLAWLAAAGIGGPYFGKIDEVSSNDLSTFLPENAESTEVKNKLGKFEDSDTLPAIIVFESEHKLTDRQKDGISGLKQKLQAVAAVKGEVTEPIVSEDGKAEFVVVPLDSNSEFDTVIAKLQGTVATANLGVTHKITGPAMFSRDLNTAFAGIDGTLLLVALSVVFIILLVVYRSPLLPVLTLMSAMMALAAAIFVVWHLAKAG